MRASLPFLVFAVSLAGCGGTASEVPGSQEPVSLGVPVPGGASSSQQPAPGTTTGPTSPTPPASCGDFGGKIHGTSSCVSMARPSAAVTPMTTRAPQPTTSVGCESQTPVKLSTSTVHLECVETGKGTATKHADVFVVIDDDTAHPEMKGKRVLLASHDGFWDFINAWFGDRTDKTEITIDYGVLE